jgi:hypothetical protein
MEKQSISETMLKNNCLRKFFMCFSPYFYMESNYEWENALNGKQKVQRMGWLCPLVAAQPRRVGRLNF